MTLSDWVVVLVLAVIAVAAVVEKVREWREPTDVERVQQSYAAGEIGEAEFERRIEFLVDDRNERIRAVVEEENGIGPETGKAIARHFDSVEELYAADREELAEVSGVCEQYADALYERFND